MNLKIKTGIGFDVHAFAPDRALIIGGVKIPYGMGLAGHSDADVLTHAIIDALAGVCLGKDIGTIFPDTDAAYKNVDSIRLLSRTVRMIKDKGYEIYNIDATIIAQSPKIAPHIALMRAYIAECVGIGLDDMAIKATTTEHLGFTGRKEGIAALAVATVCWKLPEQ